MADEPTTADPAPEPEPAADPAAQPDETDWKAEAERWKRESRKHEGRAKENAGAAKRLAEIEAANQTAQERAEAAARAAEERAAAATVRIASAEIRAALAGVVPDPAAVVEDLNVARFLTDDGEVDAEKVSALRAKYAALAPSGPRAPLPNPAQGSSQPARSLTEIIADAEKNVTDRASARTSIGLKSRQLLQQRNQG